MLFGGLLLSALVQATGTPLPHEEQPVDEPLSWRVQERYANLKAVLSSFIQDGQGRYIRLKGVNVDRETGHVNWLTEPCPPEAGLLDCPFLQQHIHTMAAVLSQSECKAGIGFSLEPYQPQNPLGPHFRKVYFPEACADLWNDLPAGQIMFEADWDLKMILHNIDEAARVLPSLRPIEALFRRHPVTVGDEVITRLWLSAPAIEVTETDSSLLFHQVQLRVKAANMEQDPKSETGLRQKGRASTAVRAFIHEINRGMELLTQHTPSLRFLEQIVVAQEAVKFLFQRKVKLEANGKLFTTWSPTSGNELIPALQATRQRNFDLLGIANISSFYDGGWLPGNLSSINQVYSPATCDTGRSFTCQLKNGSFDTVQNFASLFRQKAAMECSEILPPRNETEAERLEREAEEKAKEEEEQRMAAEREAERALAEEKKCLDAVVVLKREVSNGTDSEAPGQHGSRVVAYQRIASEGLDVGPAVFNVSGRLAVWKVGWPIGGVRGRVVLAFPNGEDDSQDWPVEDLVELQNIENGGAIGILLAHHADETSMLKPDLALGEFTVPIRLIPLFEAAALKERVERDREEVEVWLACGVARGPEPLDPEEGDPFEVEYEGSRYRTLDGALVRGADGSGCQREVIKVPEGWEMVPAYPDVLAEVVAAYPWSTPVLLLLTTHQGGVFPPLILGYGTAQVGEHAGMVVANASVTQDINSHGLMPEKCPTRILIRTNKQYITHQGWVYSTLEGAAVEGLNAGSQQREVYLAPPWHVAPVNRAVIQRVVSPFPWSTAYLLLEDGKAYPTLRGQKDVTFEDLDRDDEEEPPCYLRKGQSKAVDLASEIGTGSAGGGIVLTVEPGPRPAPCRILVRRRKPTDQAESAEAHAGSPGGGQGNSTTYQVLDTYRPDLQVSMQTCWLHDEHYLLRVNITEVVMVHGGVDLTAVKRVKMQMTEKEYDEYLRKMDQVFALEEELRNYRASNKTGRPRVRDYLRQVVKLPDGVSAVVNDDLIEVLLRKT